MPRLNIQQFRTLVASHTPAAGAVRAYRELARRPELAAAAHIVEWAAWPSAVSPANA